MWTKALPPHEAVREYGKEARDSSHAQDGVTEAPWCELESSTRSSNEWDDSGPPVYYYGLRVYHSLVTSLLSGVRLCEVNMEIVCK